MSGTPPRPRGANGSKSRQGGSSGGKSGAHGKKPQELTLDSLLEDIEREEQKTIASMPPKPSIDFGDFGEADDQGGLESLGDFDDFEEFDDLDEFIRTDENQQRDKAKSDTPVIETGIPDDESFDDDFDDDLDDLDPTADTDEPEDTAEQESVRLPDEPAEDDDPSDLWDDGAEASESPQAGFLAVLSSKLFGDGSDKEGKKQYMPLIIILLLVIIIIILLMQNCGSCSKDSTDDWFDQSAIEGTLPGKTPEEIQAMLNQIVEEGMFNISIAPVIVFENAQAQGQARIENVPANHYNMSVTITLDETAETIYESKGIRPGQYIEYINLQKDLAPGEYAATAMFHAYDADTLAEQGKVAVKITIYVEG